MGASIYSHPASHANSDGSCSPDVVVLDPESKTLDTSHITDVNCGENKNCDQEVTVTHVSSLWDQ